MEKIVKLYLIQIVWFITGIVSCFVGLSGLGFPLFNDLIIDIRLPISLIVGFAGLIGMVMLFIDQPDYCR